MSTLPTKEDLLKYIRENPRHAGKRDISRHFGVKGAARSDLKAMLRELQDAGEIEKRSGRRFVGAGELPPVTVMRVLEADEDGDVFLMPLSWEGEEAPPKVLFVARKSSPAIGAGDRVLVRLQKVAADGIAYEARLIRRIGTGADKVIGIFRADGTGGRIVSVDKGSDREWLVPAGELGGAKDGELVEAEKLDGRKVMGLPKARIVEVLGDPMAPKSISLIAIHEHQIRDVFPPEALAEAARAKPVSLGSREDLRHWPDTYPTFVVIAVDGVCLRADHLCDQVGQNFTYRPGRRQVRWTTPPRLDLNEEQFIQLLVRTIRTETLPLSVQAGTSEDRANCTQERADRYWREYKRTMCELCGILWYFCGIVV